NRRERIPDRVTVMGKRPRIDHEHVVFFSSLVNPVDQLSLVIGLAKIHFQSQLYSFCQAVLVDLIQRLPAVYLRLSLAQSVQVGTVYFQNLPHRNCPVSSLRQCVTNGGVSCPDPGGTRVFSSIMVQTPKEKGHSANS